MKTDLQIAQEATLKPISEIANQLGIDNIEPYGHYMAKVDIKDQSTQRKASPRQCHYPHQSR